MISQIVITEPVPHRVFQRDSGNMSSISFSICVPDYVSGRLEVRATAFSWRTIGYAGGSAERFAGILENVPAGEHSIYARVVGEREQVLAESVTGPIFVGDLWLLAGQSNMEGCGKLIDVEEPQNGVSCFYFGDRWAIAAEPLSWQLESDDPVHWNGAEDREAAILATRRYRVLGAGLGLSFGKEILHHTGIPVGLVMVAHGGTSMAQWDPALADRGGRSLYGSMLRVVQAVGGKVKGCLWYQGESDTSGDAAPCYYDRFKQFVESVRRDLDDPLLPFIYAQLSAVVVPYGMQTAWPEQSGWNRIQHEQLRMESEFENMALVPTIDAKLDDFIHVSTESLKEIGKRMAAASLAVAYERSVAEPGPRLARTEWSVDRTELQLDFRGLNAAFRPVERLFGFQLTSGDAVVPLTAHLTDDNRRIVLRLENPAPAACSLWHGMGLNPVVNARDERGYPLVVFGPIPV